VGPASRLAAFLLDFAIFFFLSVLFPFPLSTAVLPLLFLFFSVRLGGTPGKLLLSYRVVDQEGQFLTLPACLKRHFHILFFLVGCSLFVNAVYSEFLTENVFFILRLCGILLVLLILDFISIMIYGRWRTFHDLFAGSFVVTNTSLGIPTFPERVEGVVNTGPLKHVGLLLFGIYCLWPAIDLYEAFGAEPIRLHLSSLGFRSGFSIWYFQHFYLSGSLPKVLAKSLAAIALTVGFFGDMFYEVIEGLREIPW